jgi:hypothetical protein
MQHIYSSAASTDLPFKRIWVTYETDRGATELTLLLINPFFIEQILKFILLTGPPMWSSGQSSWLQIQRSRVRFPALSDFLRSSGSGTSPLSLVSTIVELLGRNNSCSGLENRVYGREDLVRWPRDILHPQKLALTSPARGGRSVGVVRLRTKATEFFFFYFVTYCQL